MNRHRRMILKNGVYRPRPLSDFLSSTVFDVDATIAASYDGTSQTWTNLATPADGSALTAYDFYLGANVTATTDDPTFNGSAGSKAAYFSLDGGDIFTLKSGTNTTFLNAIHKTTGGSAGWMALVYRPIDNGALRLMASKNGSNLNGLSMNSSSIEAINLVQGNGSADATSTGLDTNTVTPGSDYVLILSWDAGGGANKVRFWNNTTTKDVGSITFGTTTTDAAVAFRIGASAGNGTRIYAASMGNQFIDDNHATGLLTAYRERHNRAYA